MVEIRNRQPSTGSAPTAPVPRTNFFPLTTLPFPQFIRRPNRLILRIVVARPRKHLSLIDLQVLCFYIVSTPPQLNSFGMRSLQKVGRSEEHTSELQSRRDLVCCLLL